MQARADEHPVRPPVDALSRWVAAARAETYHRLVPLLEAPVPAALDGLLDVDPERGMTRLAWLRRGATAATPEVLKAELAKLAFPRGHGADRLDLSVLPAGRRRLLAEIGRRSTNQARQRADVARRHPVLLATLAETYEEVLDELVQLLDQALAGADSRARHERSQRAVSPSRDAGVRGPLPGSTPARPALGRAVLAAAPSPGVTRGGRSSRRRSRAWLSRSAGRTARGTRCRARPRSRRWGW